MSTYHAKSTSSTRFEVTQGDRLLGTLSYKSWFQFTAAIDMTGGKTYSVEPKGFWGTTIEVKDADEVLLKFKMNWSGEIVIQAGPGDAEKGFVLKHRGLFKNAFVLTSTEGSELLVIQPDLKWNKLSYEYAFSASEAFEALPRKELLLMASLHGANYYISLMASAAI